MSNKSVFMERDLDAAIHLLHLGGDASKLLLKLKLEIEFSEAEKCAKLLMHYIGLRREKADSALEVTLGALGDSASTEILSFLSLNMRKQLSSRSAILRQLVDKTVFVDRGNSVLPDNQAEKILLAARLTKPEFNKKPKKGILSFFCSR